MQTFLFILQHGNYGAIVKIDQSIAQIKHINLVMRKWFDLAGP